MLRNLLMSPESMSVTCVPVPKLTWEALAHMTDVLSSDMSSLTTLSTGKQFLVT